MADNDRVVFPDEVEQVKQKVAEETEATKTNSVEPPPEDVNVGTASNRNMITVPGNCPPGYQRGADGVCREVF